MNVTNRNKIKIIAEIDKKYSAVRADLFKETIPDFKDFKNTFRKRDIAIFDAGVASILCPLCKVNRASEGVFVCLHCAKKGGAK